MADAMGAEGRQGAAPRVVRGEKEEPRIGGLIAQERGPAPCKVGQHGRAGLRVERDPLRTAFRMRAMGLTGADLPTMVDSCAGVAIYLAAPSGSNVNLCIWARRRPP